MKYIVLLCNVGVLLALNGTVFFAVKYILAHIGGNFGIGDAFFIITYSFVLSFLLLNAVYTWFVYSLAKRMKHCGRVEYSKGLYYSFILNVMLLILFVLRIVFVFIRVI